MSEAKHTKGPWKAKRVSVLAGGIRITQTGYVGGASVACEEAAQRQREANARLIAAAPELLAACQAAVTATGGSKFWNGETQAFLLLCEAAIARATAENQ